MVAQYAIADARVGVVIGTGHAAECRALALTLGAVDYLAHKIPTADLESLTPQKSDEDSYGINYDNIDDFLEGKPVSVEVLTVIRRFCMAIRHKRAGAA